MLIAKEKEKKSTEHKNIKSNIWGAYSLQSLPCNTIRNLEAQSQKILNKFAEGGLLAFTAQPADDKFLFSTTVWGGGGVTNKFIPKINLYLFNIP